MELDIVSLETFNIKHRFLLLQIFLLPKNVEIYVWVQVFPLEDYFKLIYQRFINAQQNVAIIQHKIRQKRIIHTLLDKKKITSSQPNHYLMVSNHKEMWRRECFISLFLYLFSLGSFYPIRTSTRSICFWGKGIQHTWWSGN